MKNFFILFLFLSFSSCVEDDNSNYQEYETIEITTSSDILNLEPTQSEIFFHKTMDNNRFYGINNNEEIQIPLLLDLNFNLPVNSYGFRTNIEKVIQINNRYDLIKGSVTKFLNSQNFERNDTIYNIQGFNKETSGDVFLFDKQNFEYLELEEGFWINDYVNMPVQVINNKLFYIKKNKNPICCQDEIKYLDLSDLNRTPQLFYSSSDYIKTFIINFQMDLFVSFNILNVDVSNRYISHETGQEFDIWNINYPLKNHFIGVDGEFYAQHYWTTIQQPVRGFYTVDVQGNSAVASEIFTFNPNDYDYIYSLGNSNIVLPNYINNNNLIISESYGIGTILIYELNTNLGSINPLNLETNQINFADFYEDDFFIIRDHSSFSSNLRLRKIDFLNYNTIIDINLGRSRDGIVINKNNGVIYAIDAKDISKLIKINTNNTITEIELSKYIWGYFSIIN